ICEATLSRTEEECHPTVRGVRAGESVLGAEKTVALGTGLARERRLLITGEPPKQAEDRERPNPNACTGLAEHLLPRRHELIQSFPRIFQLIGNTWFARAPAGFFRLKDACHSRKSAASGHAPAPSSSARGSGLISCGREWYWSRPRLIDVAMFCR